MRRNIQTLGAVLATLALTAPAAIAQPLHDPPTPAATPERQTATVKAGDDGFDWRSAGIGAGAEAGFILIAVGGYVASYRAHPHLARRSGPALIAQQAGSARSLPVVWGPSMVRAIRWRARYTRLVIVVSRVPSARAASPYVSPTTSTPRSSPSRRQLLERDSPGGTVIALAYPTLACWALLEVGLRVREAVQGKGGRNRDRGTRVLIAISLGAAIAAASVATSVAPSLRIPVAVRVFGVIVMWLGLATRVWAVAALGGAFRTTVEVDPDQAVVTTGPYKWIRHPSYAGLLLIVAGLGLALGNWLSVAACLVLAPPALAWRIHVEEAELSAVLGDAYRAYQTSTARLIPGLW